MLFTYWQFNLFLWPRSIPLCESIAIQLSIHTLKDIWVLPVFEYDIGVCKHSESCAAFVQCWKMVTSCSCPVV